MLSEKRSVRLLRKGMSSIQFWVSDLQVGGLFSMSEYCENRTAEQPIWPCQRMTVTGW